MTLELIIIGIGVLLILVAILGSINSKKTESTSSAALLMVTLGFVGISLIIYGGYSYGNVNMQGQIEQVVTQTKLEVEYPVQRVQLISPIEGESVQCRILSMGVYPEGHEKDIWVLLKPSDEYYYPQSDHTNTSFKRKGEWQVITRFGGSQDEEYELIVYETDAAASEFFTQTIEEWKARLEYPGLTDLELPEGATELERVTVKLAENCRGVF